MPDRPDTEAIAARAEAATPGPWYPNYNDLPLRDVLAEADDETVCDDATPANAEFIAHARQDIPTLLAALDAERRGGEILAEQLVRKVEENGTLLAALATAEERAERAERLIASVTESEVVFDDGETEQVFIVDPSILANYHKATGPREDGNG